MSQLILQRLDHTGVLCDTAGHNHTVLHAHAVGQTGHAAGHGHMDAVDDVALVGIVCQLADDLALGKDGAGGTDADILGGLGAEEKY